MQISNSDSLLSLKSNREENLKLSAESSDQCFVVDNNDARLAIGDQITIRRDQPLSLTHGEVTSCECDQSKHWCYLIGLSYR